MCFELVYCCLGMLMTSCFWGGKPILRRKRITLPEPKAILRRSSIKIVFTLFIVTLIACLADTAPVFNFVAVVCICPITIVLVIPVLCFTDMESEDVSRISRDLHGVVNMIIGHPEVIKVRRTTTDLRDYIFKRECELGNDVAMPVFSGSKAEGLRFESSDDDWMFIYRNIKVKLSDSYTALYDNNTTLLIMENEMTKPGFTLLKLIGESTQMKVIWSTEYILNARYISCKRWRELHTAGQVHSVSIHGPCTSGKVGPIEFDLAYCLQCDFWPANAQDCIRRLHQCGWPPHDTILSIVNDGVLFVPIGAKQSIFEDTEWRMSFSLAE